MGSKRFTKMAWSLSRTALAVGVAAGAMGFTAASAQSDDYRSALRVYSDTMNGERSRAYEAIDLWERQALSGSVLARRTLGDLYSDQPIVPPIGMDVDHQIPTARQTGVIEPDPVKALAWYILAANHDFDSWGQTNPTFGQVNARAVAQQRVPEMMAEMRNQQVEEAQEEVVRLMTFSDSPIDLERLGRMYQSGSGLPKNNVEALKYYLLANSRGNSNAGAATAKQTLLKLMSEKEQRKAEQLAEDWQPPLSSSYVGMSPRERRMREERQSLEYARLGPALKELDEQIENGNEHLIQGALAALGMYFGPIDGSVGPQTRMAIKKFQFSLVEDDTTLTDQQKQDTMTGELSLPQQAELIRAAAVRNHPQSQYIYGVMYAEGIGELVDGKAAEEWLQKSATFGYPQAHFALGEYYRKGIYGNNPLTPSATNAQFHYGQAAALGYTPARDKLNEFYESNFAQ